MFNHKRIADSLRDGNTASPHQSDASAKDEPFTIEKQNTEIGNDLQIFRTRSITIEQACLLDLAMQEYKDILKYGFKHSVLQHYSQCSQDCY